MPVMSRCTGLHRCTVRGVFLLMCHMTLDHTPQNKARVELTRGKKTYESSGYITHPHAQTTKQGRLMMNPKTTYFTVFKTSDVTASCACCLVELRRDNYLVGFRRTSLFGLKIAVVLMK